VGHDERDEDIFGETRVLAGELVDSSTNFAWRIMLHGMSVGLGWGVFVLKVHPTCID
jgi:hypothetical protein